MITNFCIDDNGYIIQDTVPRDKDGNITTPLHMNGIEYDYDLLESMIKPKYNFTTELFEDEGLDYDYLIDQMNAESDPILKEELRMKAYYRLLLISMFFLWGCENKIVNNDAIFNNLVSETTGKNAIVFIKPDGYLYKKSLLYPYEEIPLTTKKVEGAISSIGKNIIAYKDNSNGYLNIKSILEADNETQLTNYKIGTEGTCRISNNEIAFVRNSDGYLLKINIDTLTTIPLTNFAVAWPCEIGNRCVSFLEAATGNLYKINIDTLTITQLTDYLVVDVSYYDTNNILYVRSGKTYIFNHNTMVEAEFLDYETYYKMFINNRYLFYKKTGSNLYKLDLNTMQEVIILEDVYDFPTYVGDKGYYFNYYNDYYNNKKPEIITFIQDLNNIKLATATELSDFYITTQTLREKYKIYAVENIDDIQDVFDSDRLWLQQMNSILGGSL